MPQLHETRIGQQFLEGTMPRIAKALEQIAVALKTPEVAPPSDPWKNDDIQFPRLLVEVQGVLEAGGYNHLLSSMDLNLSQLNELFERAEDKWEKVKPKSVDDVNPRRPGHTRKKQPPEEMQRNKELLELLKKLRTHIVLDELAGHFPEEVIDHLEGLVGE